jgi:hypothetical protein
MIQYNEQPKKKIRYVVERGPEGWIVTPTHNQNVGSFSEFHFSEGLVQRIILWAVDESHARLKARAATKAFYEHVEEAYLDD